MDHFHSFHFYMDKYTHNSIRHSSTNENNGNIVGQDTKFILMDLERIKRLEDCVLALQIENSTVSKRDEVDADVMGRLSNLEASVMQERMKRTELKQKLKFANTQNSRLQLRLKKEKARNAMSGYRLRGVKLPIPPEDKAIIQALIPDDNRISKSMNDIPRAACGNQGRQTQDSSDCQSFTDEDSLPRARSQVYPYTQKSNYSRDGSYMSDGVQRVGVRMDGDQALQLLPSYQQTIIQQQQEIRELCLKVGGMESKYQILVETTQNGAKIEESLNMISHRDSQIDTLKQQVRQLQITLIECENERVDAINLAKDLSLQLTRAKLAKDTALRTSRQLMEQFPTRPPKDRTPESSVPSTPSQIEVHTNPEFPLTGLKSPPNSRFLPQPPVKSRPNTPKIISTNDPSSNTMTSSPSFETATLPHSVQFFKKQTHSDTLPSKLTISNKQLTKPESKPIQTTRGNSTSSYSQDRLSPLQESPTHTKPQVMRQRSDSSPELCQSHSEIASIEVSDCKVPSKQRNKQTNNSDMKNSLSSFASGFGLKGKSKEKLKIKKVRTVEEPIAPSGIGKIHKRFSSLNSLPNAFKRSPKLEDKKKTDNSIVHPSDRKNKSRNSRDDLEMEFKHVTNPNLPFNNLKSPNGISLNRTYENLQSVPTNSSLQDYGLLIRTKKSQEIASIAKDTI